MTKKSLSEESRTRPAGRPRSEAARHEILEAAYTLLRRKGFQAVGAHEIAKLAGVSSATLYRWWKSKDEILFDACFEHVRPVLAVSDKGTGLERLRRYVLRATDFLRSENGVIVARVLIGVRDDKRLLHLFLERYVLPRREIQSNIIRDAIASGELKPMTDPGLLVDALNGPLFYRLIQEHAPLDRAFAEAIFDNVIAGFRSAPGTHHP